MKITEILEDKDTLELPDIKVGDEVKIGKWKNRKATVKGFKKDKKDNHPVLKTTKGDTKLFKPRISKIEEYKLIKTDKTKIYQNPSHKELLSLLNSFSILRGLIDSKGYLYVWDAIKAIHPEVSVDLRLGYTESIFLSVKWLDSDDIYLQYDANLPTQEANGINVYMQGDISKFLMRALGIKNENELSDVEWE